MKNNPKEYLTGFSERLIEALNSTSKSQLLEKLSISRGTLFRYLRQESYPDVRVLCEIAKATRFNLFWLLFGDDGIGSQYRTMNIEEDQLTLQLMKGDIISYTMYNRTQSLSDGLYVIKREGRYVIVRLAWNIDKEQFQICDTQHHHPIFIDSQQIIGTHLYQCQPPPLPTISNEISPQMTSHYPLSLFMKEHGIDGYQHRLSSLLKSEGIMRVSSETQISRNTLRDYINQTATPNIARLVKLANALNTSIHTLLFSNQESSSNQPRITSMKTTVIDDYFPVILPRGSAVEYRIINDTESFKSGALYAIATQRGVIIRKVAWQESTKTYVVFGDNPAYPKQYMTDVNIIGQVSNCLIPL